MLKEYDVAIIGGGIGGLMSAYTLKKNNPNLNIIIIEKGYSIEKRKCIAQNGEPCANCKICSITSGYAGSGAFSDGKFNLGTSYGGILGDVLGDSVALNYINKADEILYEYSDNDFPKIYNSNEELKLKCLQNNLRLLDMNVRHLGTDRNFSIMINFIEAIKHLGVEMLEHKEVVGIEIHKDTSHFYNHIIYQENNILDYIEAENIIFAVGRGGSSFLTYFCEQNNVKIKSNAVDIGVRVEMKDSIWDEFSSKIYEPKILYRTKTFEDKTRMFCFNKGGIVTAENNNGIITVNGHSYSDKNKRTENCNFAILTSINFTEPFNQPTVYASNISKLANIIGDNNIIVQRFGDLIRGRRTNEHRLSQNSVKPTLKATPGDISLVLPHRILTDIIETIKALNNVAPGTSNDDTLLYGCESKYYSVRPEMSNDFSILNNVYVVGDCSGICRGLSQSAAMGLYVGEIVGKKFIS